MPPSPHEPKVFLISPATAHGPRASALRRPDAVSSVARRLRQDGVPLGDVFTFLSGLYFRGKLEYARAFARRSKDEASGVYIITMTDGLVSPDTRISVHDLERYAECRDGTVAAIAVLERTAHELSQRIGSGGQVILLGSVGTGKYTDRLAPIFGDRLLFPRDVLHIGQLARGALFLRRAQEGQELEYVPVAEISRAGRRTSIKREGASRIAGHELPETPSPATQPNTEDATAESQR